MRTGWSEKTLGQSCEMYQPQTITGKELIDDGAYPVFGANGVIGRYDKFNHEAPQLLITCRGATCGAVNVSAPNSWITGNAMVVRPRDASIDLRFLEYLFRGGLDISSAITGAAQPQITRANLSPIKISYPLLPEQHRIVAILDEAIASVAAAKANAEKNLQSARAVFEDMLVAVFNAAGEQSRVEELFDVGSSKRVLKSEWKGDGVPFYRGREVTRLALEGRVDNELFISESHFAELAAKNGVPMAGDIVITAIGTIGNAHIVRESDRFYFKDASVLWMRRTSDVSSEYVKYWIRSAAFHDQLDRGNGATVDTLTIGKLEGLMIPIRSVDAQEQAVEKLARVEHEIVKLEAIYARKIAALDELKQSLLQQAFSGQL